MIEHQEILKNLVGENYLCQLQQVHVTLSHHLHDAQATHKNVADCHHLDSSLEEPKFRVRDHVWIIQRNVKTTRPCDKLDCQCLGPYVIFNQINDFAFCLGPRLDMHLYPAFHV